MIVILSNYNNVCHLKLELAISVNVVNTLYFSRNSILNDKNYICIFVKITIFVMDPFIIVVSPCSHTLGSP